MPFDVENAPFSVLLHREKFSRMVCNLVKIRRHNVFAFLFDADVLILDEPTAGLDPLSSEILKEKVIAEKNKGKLILITSHILSDLEELTTDVLYLQDGKMVFFKTMAQLFADTGEEKLARAIAWFMKNEVRKSEVAYLKIAK